MSDLNCLDKYKEANFDCLMCFIGAYEGSDKWCCGFFCQGTESLLGDGLICYLPVQGQSEQMRNKYLSGLFATPQQAVNDSYNKWKSQKKDLKKMKTKKHPTEPIQYPEIGKTYQHYKGGKYEVITLAKHTETDETLVIYKSLHFGSIHARPLSMWFDIVKASQNPTSMEPHLVRFKEIK